MFFTKIIILIVRLGLNVE